MGVPGLTAYRALHQRCKVKAGEAVLVHGASGAVGLVAVQLAVAAGCFVVGTAGTEAGLEAVRASGASIAMSHREEGYLLKCAAAVPGASSIPAPTR
jgi:NADPH2:quinone reductase